MALIGARSVSEEMTPSLTLRAPTRLTDQYRRKADDNVAAMSGQVADASGGLADDQHCEAAQRDNVRRADTRGHVADTSGGHTADQHGDTARRQNRSAD